MLGGFVKRGKSLIADQNHVCFLPENLFAGIAEQKLGSWIHLCDAQIRREDNDTFLQVVGDGMLDLDNVPDVVESPLRAFEAV